MKHRARLLAGHQGCSLHLASIHDRDVSYVRGWDLALSFAREPPVKTRDPASVACAFAESPKLSGAPVSHITTNEYMQPQSWDKRHGRTSRNMTFDL